MSRVNVVGTLITSNLSAASCDLTSNFSLSSLVYGVFPPILRHQLLHPSLRRRILLFIFLYLRWSSISSIIFILFVTALHRRTHGSSAARHTQKGAPVNVTVPDTRSCKCCSLFHSPLPTACSFFKPVQHQWRKRFGNPAEVHWGGQTVLRWFWAQFQSHLRCNSERVIIFPRGFRLESANAAGESCGSSLQEVILKAWALNLRF